MQQPVFEEIENDEHNKYWNCPINFIPDSIYSFMRLYDYSKSFPGAFMPAFNKVSPRFINAHTYFEMKYNEFLIEAQKDKK